MTTSTATSTKNGTRTGMYDYLAKLLDHPIDESPLGILTVIELSKTVIDAEYQRPLDEQKVKVMIRDWDPTLPDPLCGAWNDDDTISIVKGQHRRAALVGRDEHYFYCYVRRMTMAERAEAFVREQTSRKPLSAIDRHKAAAQYDARAQGVDAILAQFGLRVGSASRKGVVRSVGKLYSLYGHDDKGQHLRRVASTIATTWPGDTDALHQNMWSGMGKFIKTYPEIPLDELAAKLKAEPAIIILRNAKVETSTVISGESAIAVGRVIAKLWNKGRRTRQVDLTRLEARTNSPAALVRHREAKRSAAEERKRIERNGGSR